jgi:thiamine-monophosphate kinase
MLSEFELIRRFFTRDARRAILGVGDDCALLAVPPGAELAVSTDMLVCGVHFFADARPDWLGHKALAVNLSDLAAMGAVPRWTLLALALPAADESWLSAFAAGFFALADRYGVELVGGDTTRGPLNICITVGGELPAGSALRRDGAKPGDDVWVSGTTGDAALALAGLRHEVSLAADDAIKLGERLLRPMPRVELGIALRGIANSAIDVSDGLAADLGHVLERSGCGASIEFSALPRSAEFLRCTDHAVATRCAIAGGDDYELCFTAAPAQRGSIAALSGDLGLPLTMIGRIDSAPGLRVRDAAGCAVAFDGGGYEHFR